jgi:hypothetical protein
MLLINAERIARLEDRVREVQAAIIRELEIEAQGAADQGRVDQLPVKREPLAEPLLSWQSSLRLSGRGPVFCGEATKYRKELND